MRERFSAVIRKPVYTLQFDRYTAVQPALVTKFERAAAQRAVVCSSPPKIVPFFETLMNRRLRNIC